MDPISITLAISGLLTLTATPPPPQKVPHPQIQHRHLYHHLYHLHHLCHNFPRHSLHLHLANRRETTSCSFCITTTSSTTAKCTADIRRTTPDSRDNYSNNTRAINDYQWAAELRIHILGRISEGFFFGAHWNLLRVLRSLYQVAVMPQLWNSCRATLIPSYSNNSSEAAQCLAQLHENSPI